MNLGPTELIILVFIALPAGVIIWGIVDAANRPNDAWLRAKQSKALWITLQAVGLAICYLGWIASLIYFVAVRPRVVAAQSP